MFFADNERMDITAPFNNNNKILNKMNFSGYFLDSPFTITICYSLIGQTGRFYVILIVC